jgi:alkanesulfonate monooxygenase SsuD/methylene tetrahydromethanopterin reductase-like flavin-dependent oxidoreductase (luciferase family)
VARNDARHSMICGSPATVAKAIAEIDSIGVGGLLMVFRIGPMAYEVAEKSITLFMQEVAPKFRATAVQPAPRVTRGADL